MWNVSVCLFSLPEWGSKVFLAVWMVVQQGWWVFQISRDLIANLTGKQLVAFNACQPAWHLFAPRPSRGERGKGTSPLALKAWELIYKSYMRTNSRSYCSFLRLQSGFTRSGLAIVMCVASRQLPGWYRSTSALVGPLANNYGGDFKQALTSKTHSFVLIGKRHAHTTRLTTVRQVSVIKYLSFLFTWSLRFL